MITRSEIWLVSLDSTVDDEIRKTRPCPIGSPNEMNDHLRTLVVAPITNGSSPAPFRVAVRFKGESGLILLTRCA